MLQHSCCSIEVCLCWQQRKISPAFARHSRERARSRAGIHLSRTLLFPTLAPALTTPWQCAHRNPILSLPAPLPPPSLTVFLPLFIHPSHFPLPLSFTPSPSFSPSLLHSLSLSLALSLSLSRSRSRSPSLCSLSSLLFSSLLFSLLSLSLSLANRYTTALQCCCHR
jgi:hypothetical protein